MADDSRTTGLEGVTVADSELSLVDGLGLAALGAALRLPRGAPAALFAVGRTAGWVTMPALLCVPSISESRISSYVNYFQQLAASLHGALWRWRRHWSTPRASGSVICSA